MKTIKHALFIALALTLILSACTTAITQSSPTTPPATAPALAANTQPPDSTKNITLTVWWWGEPEAPGSGTWLKARADDYHAQHPNVSINLVEQNIDSVTTAFRAAAASKSGPDIAYFFSGGVYVMEDTWAGNIAPISDYATKEQMADWIDTSSKTYDGKVWTMPYYMQSYLMMYNKDLFKKAGLDPEKPPQTMDELITDCGVFNKAGITPIAAGMKDAFQGGIFYSELGVQTLMTATSVQKAAVGLESYTDPEHAGWWDSLNKMVAANCFNKDANSLDVYSGWEVFGKGQSAMLQANDGYLPIAIKDLGQENVGIMRMPRFASGALGEDMCAFSQGLGITSWSANKQDAANFLISLHQKQNVDSFYQTTGIPLADKKFDVSLLKSPQQKQEYQWIATRPQLCPELIMPLEVWETGLMPASQAIFQQSMSPADAAKQVEATAKNWRDSNPPNLDKWKTWANSK
jgi:raffinose/stachyose/melibiose transport system substrate-binding protein